jgi:hypothetical protein
MMARFSRLTMRKVLSPIIVGLVVWSVLFLNDAAPTNHGGSLVSSAEAVVGRPRTPVSYAGVARRTTRRAVVAGAAAGAHASGCVRVTNAYGQVVTRCR